MMDRSMRTVDDVLRLLDDLFAPEADRWTADAASWWDRFYADRSKPVPFFVAKPDENLVSYLDRGLITPGRALDIGCGTGRNAIHLACAGFEVHAVDLSPAAIAWAEDRARQAGADVHFHCGDVFAPTAADLGGPYDLIYDSGCFHHLPPHRRISYLALLSRVLATYVDSGIDIVETRFQLNQGTGQIIMNGGQLHIAKEIVERRAPRLVTAIKTAAVWVANWVRPLFGW